MGMAALAVVGLDRLHRADGFEPAERGVERAERDGAAEAHERGDPLAQLVPVEVLVLEQPQHRQLDHALQYIESIHRRATMSCAIAMAAVGPPSAAARTAAASGGGDRYAPRRELPGRFAAQRDEAPRPAPASSTTAWPAGPLISEYRKGRLARHQVCDAHPELLRAARGIGRETSRRLPDLRGATGSSTSPTCSVPGWARQGRCVSDTQRARRARPPSRPAHGLRGRGVPDVLVAPPRAHAAGRRPTRPARAHSASVSPRRARAGSACSRRSTSARRRRDGAPMPGVSHDSGVT